MFEFMNGKFVCGAAKADITPEESLIKDLYGLMSISYAGVLDPLFLRVLAFSDGGQKALVVSFDLDKAPNPVTWIPEIVGMTGIPEENISYFSTHNHSAPLHTMRPGDPHAAPKTKEQKEALTLYEAFIKEKLFDAVREALENMQPAKMGYGWGESYINMNRNAEFYYEAEDGKIYPYVALGAHDSAPVDRSVFVMKVEDLNGNPLAFFVNYAVHCCTMFRNRYDEEGHMGISGDIAGNVSRSIEEKFPGSVAVWSSGAAGDVNPIIGNEVYYPSPEDGSRIEWLFPDAETIHTVMLSLAYRHFADILRVIRQISCTSDSVKVGGALEWSETPFVDSEEETYGIRLHLLRLGDVALCGIGGELFSSFGRQIRQKSPLKNTVVINHDASLIRDAGYIMDDEALARVRRKVPKKGMVPGAGNRIEAGKVGPSLLKHTESLFQKVL